MTAASSATAAAAAAAGTPLEALARLPASAPAVGNLYTPALAELTRRMLEAIAPIFGMSPDRMRDLPHPHLFRLMRLEGTPEKPLPVLGIFQNTLQLSIIPFIRQHRIQELNFANCVGDWAKLQPVWAEASMPSVRLVNTNGFSRRLLDNIMRVAKEEIKDLLTLPPLPPEEQEMTTYSSKSRVENEMSLIPWPALLEGVAGELKESFERILDVDEKVVADNCYLIGTKYLEGYGVFPRSLEMAVGYLLLAADRGHKQALDTLDGIGKRAIGALQKKDAQAEFTVGLLLELGYFRAEKKSAWSPACGFYREATQLDRNCAAAWAGLGREDLKLAREEEGDGCFELLDQAEFCFNRAKETNHPWGWLGYAELCHLGLLKGWKRENLILEAVNALKKSASFGLAIASIRLGVSQIIKDHPLQDTTLSEEQRIRSAFNWFEEGLRWQFPEAYLWLASLHLKGYSNLPDLEAEQEASMYLLEGIKQGSPDCWRELAGLFRKRATWVSRAEMIARQCQAKAEVLSERSEPGLK